MDNMSQLVQTANDAAVAVAAIINSGATVKFVDIGEDYLMDVNKIERLINNNTKVIMFPQLFCSNFSYFNFHRKKGGI